MICVGGAGVSSSQLLPGLLIEGTLGSLHSPTHSVSGQTSTKVLTLLQPLRRRYDPAATTVEARDATKLRELLSLQDRTVYNLVHEIYKQGVRLVVCTARLHPATVKLLTALGITTLHAVDKTDLNRLSVFTGVGPESVLNLQDLSGKRVKYSLIKAFRMIQLDSRIFLHLSPVPMTDTPSRVKRGGGGGGCYTLLLRAPLEELARQYAQRVKGLCRSIVTLCCFLSLF